MKKYSCFLLLVLLFSCARTHSVVSIQAKDKVLSEKEAILIIPGFGSKMFGNKDQEKYFIDKGYDVFIPNYISRNSIAQSLSNLEKFIAKNKLNEYKKIHVFSYIVGSWVLNNYIKSHPENNIASIVYDRSPAQERAPYALITDMPVLIRMVSGKIMREFANTPYSSIENKNIRVGIIIEDKATRLIQKHRATAMKMGELNRDVKSLNQGYDDYFYTWLNHDQMYSRFDIIGNEIFYFFKNGTFTVTAQRKPNDWDLFETYIEKK